VASDAETVVFDSLSTFCLQHEAQEELKTFC